MRPFLKWAGGKNRLVERIGKALPRGSRLIEPFVGSGAVFLNVYYRDYLLADTNEDLIGLYQTLQQEGEAFITYCRTWFTPENNDSEAYYAFRQQFNTTADRREKSALFLYLNRHGYNGLCRYNASGGFNVPFGRYKKPYFPAAEMHYFHQRAESAVFKCQDFVTTIEAAEPGDVVYCDPPYVPLSATANFTSYSAGGFGAAEQERLAELATKLAQQGVPVVISNHDTEFTREAYAQSEIHSFSVRRNISCDPDNREMAKELLAAFTPRQILTQRHKDHQEEKAKEPLSAFAPGQGQDLSAPASL